MASGFGNKDKKPYQLLKEALHVRSIDLMVRGLDTWFIHLGNSKSEIELISDHQLTFRSEMTKDTLEAEQNHEPISVPSSDLVGRSTRSLR
jgi:hypothetical protein